MTTKRVLVFDSGLGGLSVARAIMAGLPDVNVIYSADNEGFPYGDWSELELKERICSVADRLIEQIKPDAMVVACNTASTIALSALRERFAIPFVGTVPAIKPAAEVSRSGIIGVLATPGTVDRAYTQALVDTYASHREVMLHGCKNLAAFAERALRGDPVSEAEMRMEISPVFVEKDGGRTDAVVLGCTHYPLIADQISSAASWPVSLIDPSDAIARQVGVVLIGRSPLRPADVGVRGAFLTKTSSVFSGILAREGFAGTNTIAAA